MKIIKRVIQNAISAWNPDFTKLTPAERESLELAEAEIDSGEYVTAEEIDWS